MVALTRLTPLMRELAASGLSPLSVATLAALEAAARPGGASEAEVRACVSGEAEDLVPVALECLSTAGEIFSVRVDVDGGLGPTVWRLTSAREVL